MQKKIIVITIYLASLLGVCLPTYSKSFVNAAFHLNSISNLEDEFSDFEFQLACSLFCNDVYLEDSTYSYSIANGVSNLSRRDIFQYTSAGLLMEDVNSIWQTPANQWVNSKRFLYSYDALGNRIQRLRHDWNTATQSWVSKYKYSNTFDANQNRIQSIRQNWDAPTGTWVNGVKYTYSYDANNNLIERVKQVWNGAVWVNNARYLNTYDAANLRLENVKYVWDAATSEWNFDSKYDYTYDANCNLVLRIKSDWNGVSWELDEQTEYSYDADGNLDFWVKSDRVGNSWVEKSSKFSFWRFFNFAPTSTSLPDTILLKTDPIGTLIGNFITLDPDDSQFTYTFAVGDGQNDLDNALFAINGNALVSNASFVDSVRTEFFVFIQIDDGQGGICQQAFTILVQMQAEVVITPVGPFCENEPIQTLTATPSGGVWGGAANASGQIDPAILGAGSHLVTYSFTDSNGFTSNGQIAVQINALPNVGITAAGPFCEGETIQNLSANPAGGIWGGAANAAGQIDPAALGAGLHTVTYSFTDGNGCSNSESMQLQVVGLPTVNLSGAGSVCSGGGSTIDLTFTVTGSGTITVFYDIDGVAQSPLTIANSSFVLSASLPGLYTITGVEDENFCSNTGSGSALITEVGESAEISLNLTSDFDGQAISCAGESDGSVEVLIVSGGSMPFSYQWLNGSTSNQADSLAEGWHFVTVTDSKGCRSIDSIFLTAPSPLESSLTITEGNCFDGNSGAINIDSVTGGSGPFLYSLNNSAFQMTSQFLNLSSGTYELVVQDANGCEATEVLSVSGAVELKVDLGADKFIQLGETVELNANVIVPEETIDTIIWTPNDSMECLNCLNTVVHPLFTTTYSIAVKTRDGCVGRDQLTVFVNSQPKVFAPNAFTPNGDGNNDFFILFAGSEAVEIKTLLVFDRQGNIVFETNQAKFNDLESGWDGTFRGRKLRSAVFAYFAEIVSMNGQTSVVKGDVVLLQ